MARRRRWRPKASDWMLVRSQPMKERWAAKNIEAQGWEVYYPRYELPNGLLKPLFPTYLFVNVASGSWAGLAGTRGVSQLVMFGGSPALVRNSVVRAMKKEERAGRVEVERLSRLKPGDVVAVRTGTFAGFSGVYQGMGPKRVAEVIVKILGYDTPAQFKVTNLRKVRGG